jgi:hypothetical protein
MVDVGTTTVVDFAHINYSSEHSKLLHFMHESWLTRSSECSRGCHGIIWPKICVRLLSHRSGCILEAIRLSSGLPSGLGNEQPRSFGYEGSIRKWSSTARLRI